MESETIIARAPVRISFGGGGTDLAAYYLRYGGFVVSTAITRYCYVIAQRPADGSIRLISADYRLRARYARGELPPVEEPLALAKAALAEFAADGVRDLGVDLVLGSEVPPGTGLGSSSAMAVALVRALCSYTGRASDPAGIAEMASLLEIERLGMPIGKQDQYASAFGGLNALEFSADGVRVTPLDLPADTLDALESRLLLFSTGQTHDSAQILREQRADTQSNPLVVESLHHIKALALAMRDALLAGNLDEFGALLDASWRQKRQLSHRISTATIDAWYAAARAAGALGGKIAGAGGGGFLLLCCPPQRRGAVRRVMAEHGLRELRFRFDQDGVQELTEFPTAADRYVASLRAW